LWKSPHSWYSGVESIEALGDTFFGAASVVDVVSNIRMFLKKLLVGALYQHFFGRAVRGITSWPKNRDNMTRRTGYVEVRAFLV
jgi:hypothetical protein